MFNFLTIFGSASLTYLLVKKICKEGEKNWYEAVISIIAYAMANTLLTYLILEPFGLIGLVEMQNRLYDLQFGRISIIVEIIISILMAVTVSYVKMKVSITLEVKSKTNER